MHHYMTAARRVAAGDPRRLASLAAGASPGQVRAELDAEMARRPGVGPVAWWGPEPTPADAFWLAAG